MFGTHNLAVFLVTALMLTVIPGPSTLYVLGRSIAQGRRAGALSVLGIAAGTVCHILAVAFGLSALLAASQIGFSLIKCAGAAYLVFQGVQTLRKRAVTAEVPPVEAADVRAGFLFGHGMVTQILNPKVALFFIALLPQFVRPADAHSPLPFLFLGLLFVAQDTAWFLAVAVFSAFFTTVLRRNSRCEEGLKWATGLLYIGLGLNLLRVKARLAS